MKVSTEGCERKGGSGESEDGGLGSQESECSAGTLVAVRSVWERGSHMSWDLTMLRLLMPFQSTFSGVTECRD